MTTRIFVCLNCIYYFRDRKCLAFPEVIPVEILNAENDHTELLENQKNNITFERIV